MSNLNFIRKLYNGKNCYSDHMSEEEMKLIHVPSKVEEILVNMVNKNKIIFLTGNPGDGKTFIIKTVKDQFKDSNIYIETDLNNVKDYASVIAKIQELYSEGKGGILAVNEYPFMQLCKQLKTKSEEIYKEIKETKKKTVAYGISEALTGKIAVIDLNERNLLGADYDIISDLVDRFIELLEEEEPSNATLKDNIAALTNQSVRKQLLDLFYLAAAEHSHYAIRDILGALSFIITACTTEEYENLTYYSAIFEGNNVLLKAMQQFDPVFLSSPELDEALWNGAIKDDWQISSPERYPIEFEEVDEALQVFKNLKRKYYFEHSRANELTSLQPSEITKCTKIFTSFESQKKKTKESLIRSINKLFLPSMDEKKQLYIWTTHKYDMSQATNVAISSRAIDSSELDIQMQKPATWLEGIEYVPDHIIMKPKNADEPRLVMNVDFLRTLDAIENGYPVGLLAPHYEQSAAMFLQQLDDEGLAEELEDGEIILASRTKSFKRTVRIQEDLYGFEED